MNKIDQQYNQSLILIEQLLYKYNKHIKIRVQLWLKKLACINTNDIWKKNRNNYIKLLVEVLSSQKFIDPFCKMPPQGSLPHLKDHQIKHKLQLIRKDEKTKIYRNKDLNISKEKQGSKNHSQSSDFCTKNLTPSTKLKFVEQENDKSYLTINNTFTNKSCNKKLINQDLLEENQKLKTIVKITEKFLHKHSTQFIKNDNEYNEILKLIKQVRFKNDQKENECQGIKHILALQDSSQSLQVFTNQDQIEYLKFGFS